MLCTLSFTKPSYCARVSDCFRCGWIEGRISLFSCTCSSGSEDRVRTARHLLPCASPASRCIRLNSSISPILLNQSLLLKYLPQSKQADSRVTSQTKSEEMLVDMMWVVAELERSTLAMSSSQTSRFVRDVVWSAYSVLAYRPLEKLRFRPRPWAASEADDTIGDGSWRRDSVTDHGVTTTSIYTTAVQLL